MVIRCFLWKNRTIKLKQRIFLSENVDNDHIAEGELRTPMYIGHCTKEPARVVTGDSNLGSAQLTKHRAHAGASTKRESLFLINYPEWVLFLPAQILDTLAVALDKLKAGI